MTTENTQSTDATSGNVDQNTTETKSENTVPSYRLKEEADRRRAAETKLAEYEVEAQKRADKDLGAQELLVKEQARTAAAIKELNDFKELTAKKGLQSEFVNQAIELGFPSKIAKLGAPDNLSGDNMKDSLKAFTKEFAEFLPNKEETKAPTNPYTAMQPQTVSPVPGKSPEYITGPDVVNDILKNRK